MDNHDAGLWAWLLGIANIIFGGILLRGVPWAVGMHSDVSALKTEMQEMKQLRSVVHEMDKKLDVVIDRMPKRKTDEDHA